MRSPTAAPFVSIEEEGGGATEPEGIDHPGVPSGAGVPHVGGEHRQAVRRLWSQAGHR